MSAAVDTRRLYRFEELFLHTRGMPGMKDTSIGALRDLAARIWADSKKPSHDLPPIKAGAGTVYNGELYSFYEDRPVHRIVLARGDRRPVILIHELTHAMGVGKKGDHDKQFCGKYFELLHKYLGYDLGELELQAANFRIRT